MHTKRTRSFGDPLEEGIDDGVGFKTQATFPDSAVVPSGQTWTQFILEKNSVSGHFKRHDRLRDKII